MGRRVFKAMGMWVAFVALGSGASACGDDPVGNGDALTGGVLATFAVGQDRFRVWVTNPVAANTIMELQAGTSLANIPNGSIRQGPGVENHNAPWNWHLDSNDIEMAELTTEVCDGAPSYVETHLNDYLQIGRYCPWGAQLVSADDRR